MRSCAAPTHLPSVCFPCASWTTLFRSRPRSRRRPAACMSHPVDAPVLKRLAGDESREQGTIRANRLQRSLRRRKPIFRSRQRTRVNQRRLHRCHHAQWELIVSGVCPIRKLWQNCGIADQSIGDSRSSARSKIRHRSLVDMDRCGPKMPTRNPESKKPSRVGWAKCLNLLVGREGLEHSTYGLRVRCSTNWANAPN